MRLYLLLFSLSILSCPALAQYTQKTPGDGGTGKVYIGREIAQVMGSGNGGWLERPNREQEENSNKIIATFPLRKDAIVADIGAGTGYYAFRVAKRVPQGKVFAVEVQDEFVKALDARKTRVKQANLEVIKGSEQSPNLPARSADLVFMVDVYHELLYPKEMIASIRKSLKPGGRLVLVEYKAEDPSVAIRELHKLSVEQADREMAAAGFKRVGKAASFPMQHVLIYAFD
ncbi:MAG: class I SAM-dependent methyltransferase [Mucilaginibacter polytrichastri]|nr:class I SAM-dependent methyltransferase [Mucilaginibacter polytrichastri]